MDSNPLNPSFPFKTFNAQLRQMVEELQKVFPEENKLATVLHKLDVAETNNIRAPVQLFYKQTSPYTELLLQCDDTAITHLEKVLPGMLEIWKKCDDYTKNCVWQYVIRLVLISEALNSVSEKELANVMKNILTSVSDEKSIEEGVAEDK